MCAERAVTGGRFNFHLLSPPTLGVDASSWQPYDCLATNFLEESLLHTNDTASSPAAFEPLPCEVITAESQMVDPADRASQEYRRLAAIASKTTNAVVLTDSSRRITWVNESFERLTGFSLWESIGRSPGELLQYDKTSPKTKREIRKALTSGLPYKGRIQNRSKSGREYWLELDIHPLFDHYGTLDGFIAIENDITELVEACETAERQFREISALRNALDRHSLLSIADTEGKIVEVNSGFCAASGYTREELLAKDHRLINSGYHPKSFWADVWNAVSNGEAWRGEICNRAKNGSLFWVDATIAPILGKTVSRRSMCRSVSTLLRRSAARSC